MSITSGVDRFSNSSLLTEENFNITPANTAIWTGDIPYKEGDTFPTQDIIDRANEYLTNLNLYRNRFNGILDNVFSWTDYMMNPITNFPNLAICANLPDWYTATEAWVSLFSESPEIDTNIDIESQDFDTINGKLNIISSILKNSNFAETWQDIIRCAQIVFGNKIVRVDKVADGRVRLTNMPVKCWQPFVNPESTSSIQCNLFFNIFTDKNGQSVCEFIAYVEDGKIIKKSYEYIGTPGSGKLGSQIGDTKEGEAFDGMAEISPIVVFKGNSINGDIFGESQYKYWDASISSAIRNFEAIGVLVEQAKELVRKIPSGATKTDEFTGVTYQNRTGAIAYSDLEHSPDIEYIKCQVQLDQVINAYKESIARVSRDTGLPASFFDTREINIAASGTALKTAMYRTNLMSNTIANSLEFQIKQLINKIATACGIDVDDSSWGVTVINKSMVIDDKEQSDIIQARVNGDRPTMSVAQAIKEYEGVSIDVAVKKAARLEGREIPNIDVPQDTLETGSGDNLTSDGIEFTATEHNENEGARREMIEYPMGILPI